MPRARLIELSPWDPVAAAVVTLRASSVDDPSVCSLNSQTWWPAVARRPLLRIDGFDGNFTGEIESSASDIELATWVQQNGDTPQPDFYAAPRYAWAGKRCRMWSGNVGDAWGSYTLDFDGIVTSARAARGRLQLSLRVDDSWFDRPVLGTLYAGTGAAEGPAALKGTPKPLAIGAPKFCAPVLIDAVNNVYQFSGYGSIRAVTSLFDRLVAFGSAAGDDANYAALVAASIAPGAWRTCLAEGMVRLGAPPSGILCGHVEGDNGSTYGWARLPGAVISRLASLAGATSGQIDATSMSALSSAVPYNLSAYITTAESARSLIQGIAASANAAAGISLTGKLYAAPVAIGGSAALTLATAGTALPPVASAELLPVAAPFWRLAMAYARSFTVHGPEDYGVYDYADIGGTKPPADADNTAAASPDVTGDFAWSIAGDVAGTVITTLPANRRFVALEGTTNVSATTSWALSDIGPLLAITVNNTSDRGLVTLGSGTTGSGTAKLTATLPGGGVVERIITVTKTNATAPATGGAGATSASDTSFTSVSSGSHATISDELTVRSDGAGKVRIAASSEFDASATATQNVAVKFAYATSSGGALTDLISEVTANAAIWNSGDSALEPGNFNIVEAQFTMPAANTDYYFKLRARRVTGSATINFYNSSFTVRQ